jgi:hypothetical protein
MPWGGPVSRHALDELVIAPLARHDPFLPLRRRDGHFRFIDDVRLCSDAHLRPPRGLCDCTLAHSVHSSDAATCLELAHFGLVAMSELSPSCAPKRTWPTYLLVIGCASRLAPNVDPGTGFAGVRHHQIARRANQCAPRAMLRLCPALPKKIFRVADC